MTALQQILQQYRQEAQTEREKGTYFEELILCYFQNEASYKSRFAKVWLFADWAKDEGIKAHDTGIDHRIAQRHHLCRKGDRAVGNQSRR